MAITRKPKPLNGQTGAPVDVEALIHRGGSHPVREAAQEAKSEPTAVILRIPPSMLKKIDEQLKDRPIKTPRHTWLLEAIHEKLTRG